MVFTYLVSFTLSARSAAVLDAALHAEDIVRRSGQSGRRHLESL